MFNVTFLDSLIRSHKQHVQHMLLESGTDVRPHEPSGTGTPQGELIHQSQLAIYLHSHTEGQASMKIE